MISSMWEIVNQSYIVWEAWVLNFVDGRITFRSSFDPDMRLVSHISDQDRRWRVEEINNALSESEKVNILSTPLTKE